MGEGRRRLDVPVVREGVAEFHLDLGQAHVLSTAATREGPEMAHQDAVDPRSIHVEKCRRRSGGPLLSAQGRVGRGRELDDGTGAPDPLCCLGRRQEKGDVDVPEPCRLFRAWDMDDRHVGATDDTPVLGQPQGDTRLETQRRLGVTAWPGAEAETQRRGQVDRVRQRIELLLGDTAHLCSGFLPPCGKRAEHQRGERQVDDQPDGDADFHMDD